MRKKIEKNFWDMEIIGNRRKMFNLVFQRFFLRTRLDALVSTKHKIEEFKNLRIQLIFFLSAVFLIKIGTGVFITCLLFLKKFLWIIKERLNYGSTFYSKEIELHLKYLTSCAAKFSSLEG